MDCWPLWVWGIGAFLSFVGMAAYCGIANVKMTEGKVDVVVAFCIAIFWPLVLMAVFMAVIIFGLFSVVKKAAAKIRSPRELKRARKIFNDAQKNKN